MTNHPLLSGELTAIRTFTTAFEAELARSVLEAAGIDAVVRSDDAGGLHPGMWTATGVRLLVRPTDATLADEVLTAPTLSIDFSPPPNGSGK